MSVLPSMAGMQVACPHCGKAFTVPPDSVSPASPPFPPQMGPNAPQQPPMDPRMMQYYGAPPQKTSGLAIASLVLGILSICAGLLGLIAIGLGIAAHSSINSNSNMTGKGMATWGIVLGILGAAVNYILLFLNWEEYKRMFGM